MNTLMPAELREQIKNLWINSKLIQETIDETQTLRIQKYNFGDDKPELIAKDWSTIWEFCDAPGKNLLADYSPQEITGLVSGLKANALHQEVSKLPGVFTQNPRFLVTSLPQQRVDTWKKALYTETVKSGADRLIRYFPVIQGVKVVEAEYWEGRQPTYTSRVFKNTSQSDLKEIYDALKELVTQ
jgi:hypothetical protein